MPNEQTELNEVDKLRLTVVSVKSENAQLRQQIASLEASAFQAHIQATYGNPGQPIQIQADGTILRLPPEFGKPDKPKKPK